MNLFSVDREKCKRDGLCVESCPIRIIEFHRPDGFPELVEGAEQLCINCGHCVAVCPQAALSLRTMKPEDCDPVRSDLLPSTEQLEHFLRHRRSIRAYKKETVGREALLKVIHMARWAPSGHNDQPVRWLIIETPDEVRKLASLVIDWMREKIDSGAEVANTLRFDRVIQSWENGTDRVLRSAPHMIIAHADRSLRTANPACAIALTYAELAALALGLGACWAGYFNYCANDYRPMQEALSLPAGHTTFGALMVGYPKYRHQRIPLRNEPRIAWR
ncbi:MAG: nitroreductase family protein [Deltaproteobacteria bacterium]|nr:nitroreductase family protein [Deltaproteobacteria bacterium]